MTSAVEILTGSFQQLFNQLVYFIPKIIIALLIWWIGSYLLGVGIKLTRKIDIKGTKLDEKIVKTLTSIIWPVGKILLALIVLDYLGIGRTIISAFANGLTFAVAIALGIAFGDALKTDAQNLISELRKQWQK